MKRYGIIISAIIAITFVFAISACRKDTPQVSGAEDKETPAQTTAAQQDSTAEPEQSGTDAGSEMAAKSTENPDDEISTTEEGGDEADQQVQEDAQEDAGGSFENGTEERTGEETEGKDFRREGRMQGRRGFRRGPGARPGGEDQADAEDAQEAGPPAPGDPNSPEEDDNMVAINLNNVEMKHIIKTIGDWTGKSVIPTTDELIRQRLTIYTSEKMEKEEALSLIYAALRTKGFVPEETDSKIFLKPIAKAKVGSVPTIGVDEPLARVANKSQIVEKFFKIENYSPSKVAEIVTPLLADYGHVTAVESSNYVSVIDTVENLMRIERIIEQLDVPESEQTVEKLFEIKNGDPLEIVQVVELILSEGRNNRGRNFRRPSNNNRPGGNNGASPATSVVIESEDVEARLIPLPKQNWIIARASAADMKLITNWIEKLDIPESVKQEQTVIPVRHVDARQVVDIVKRTLQSMPGSELRASVVVEALADSRQVVVFGSEENRKMVERMIAEVDLPSEDTFKEKTFKLKHADPDQIKENIDNLYGEETTSSYNYYRYRYGSQQDDDDTVKVISYPTLRQVTVIASEANLKKIEGQVKEWDVPLDVSEEQYQIVTLKNSDPVKMCDLLKTLFSEDSDSSSNFFRSIFGRGRDSETKKKIVGSLYGLLTFEPVPDTKKIIVISKIPEAYDVIRELVEELDSQEMAEVPRVITLNYADAEDLCDQLNAILNEPGTTATIRRRVEGLSVNSDSSEEVKSGEASANDQNNNPGELRPWWDGQRRTDDEMPTSNLIGQVRFIPVQRSKALLVLAPPEYMDAIEQLVEELDKPGKQVMVKAAILQVDHSSMTSLGVQLSSNAQAFGNLGENAVQALSNLANAGSIGSWTIDTTVPVNTLIDFLVKEVNAKVLNQPTLWTKDNEEAVFVKARNIAFVVADQSDSSNLNNIRRTFDYKDVGVTLRVRPNITPENFVDTTVYLEVSTLESELVNGQPATNRLDTTTHLIVDDGETIMLGGILFQQDSLTHRKVPLLGDIPLVGQIFNHYDNELVNSELLIFLTPYVVENGVVSPASLDEVQGPKLNFEEIIEELNETLSAEDLLTSQDPNTN
ncbi:Pectic enzymes secretion protein OutD [Anaerohalosphaera lusitana]|uniref:Pectic enzymes secretion protein OutD n=1 Tax=Anaerohalosphaera lusitana TaxID=1936003 RepID=A0A1U9NJT2_9BACT|nr:secretin N-terminal domain-containing protein [Anaerohalosphaera lusitana]AQT68182.1 Pectic enzymes secretion protein OutD [Anaerohalosphaera lusitana]